MIRYFDSHAHYYDDRFAEECAEGVDSLLCCLFDGNVAGIVNVGTNPETSRLAIAQAVRYPGMYTAVGIHPTDCQSIPDEDFDRSLAEIEALAGDPSSKCVMLGEIGLDYHYPDTQREKQLRYFEAQLELARKLDLPVCIHDRDAHGDTVDVLRRHPGVRAILHSFSGSADMARALIPMGCMVSFSGTVSFTNAKKPREAAAVVPHDRLLIETDCPYLAPHPLRGTLNHSGNLAYTNAALAAAIGLSAEETAELTLENACRFLGVPQP